MSAAKILAASFGLGLFSWLTPATIDIVSWQRGGVGRIALLPPLRMLEAALAVSALLAAVLWWVGGTATRDVRAHIAAPIIALWLCAVPYAPWLGDHFPLVLVLGGPVRWWLAGAVAIAVVTRLLNAAGVRDVWRLAARPFLRGGAAIVFLVSFVLFLACGLRSLAMVGLGGDEPHYLVITQSLLLDHDLKIENNHARGDYRTFYPGELRPDYLQRGVNGEIYSIHAPGLAALMLPGYALAGSRGAVLTLCLFAALAAAAVFRIARHVGGPLIAWATWASVCLSVPFIPHAWSIYPEIAGAAIAGWSAVWALEADAPGRLDGIAVWVARGAALAALPWLHTKFAALLAPLVVWLLVELRGRLKRSAALLLPVAISSASWLSFFYVVYGTLDPQAPYGGHVAQFVSGANIPRSLLGFVADQKFGLFVYSPIYVLAAAGAWRLLRDRGRRRFGWFLVGTIAVYALSSGREYMWWGGSSAPARFLVPLTPLMGGMVAEAFASFRTVRTRTIAAALAAFSVLVGVSSMVFINQALLFSPAHGTSRLLEWLQGSAPLAGAFPTFTDENWTRPLIQLLPCVAAAAAAVVVVRLLRRTSRFAITITAFATFIAVVAVSATVRADARLDAAANGRADLMHRFDPQRLRAFDYAARARITPAQWLAAATVKTEIDRLQPVDPSGRLIGPLSLPQGSYTARVWFQGARQRPGDLQLAAGDNQILGRLDGPLPNPTLIHFEIPIAVPGLWLRTADAATARQAARVEISPTSLVPASERLPEDVRAVEIIPGRPHAYMAYLDEWTYPEGGVFWTRSTGSGAVAIAPDGARAMLLTLHVGSNGGPVHLRLGNREQDIVMRAEETRTVTLPLADTAPYVILSAQAASDFRPADVDPHSTDTRRLGVQIRVEVR